MAEGGKKNALGVEGGAPFGNKNAAKGSAWRNALRDVLENYSDNGIQAGTALREIAKLCVADALNTKDAVCRAKAREEIANRLDGKPKESVSHTVGFDDTLLSYLQTLEANVRSPSAGDQPATQPLTH